MQPQHLSPPPRLPIPTGQPPTPLASPSSPAPLLPPIPTFPRRQAGRFPNDTARYYAAQVTLVRSGPSHTHGMTRTHPSLHPSYPSHSP